MSAACLVANPASGRGRGARRLPAVREALAAVGITEVHLSRGPGDERDLAAEAAMRGVETIVALGGDGTWGNVARGIMASGRDVRLVPIEAGTGNDFAVALGLPAWDDRAMARIAAGAGSVRVDMGSVNGVGFLNVAGAGIATHILKATHNVRWLSGPIVYLAAAIPQLPSYRAERVEVQFDDEAPQEPAGWIALVASNGPRYGGAFQVAPDADVTDGRLDITAVRDAGTMRRASLLGRVRFGTHRGQPEVTHRRAVRVRLHFEHVPMFDADGELHAATEPTLDIRVIPRAIRIGVPGPT